MPTSKKQCFVIMPFSKTSDKHTEDYWTAHFKDFLKPLIEGCPQLEAHRSEPLTGDIQKQILTNLLVSPIVVADLTDYNPNVFWELGVRQSFRHGTITIAEDGTALPFDIFSKGTLFYKSGTHINKEFCDAFNKAIESCLSKMSPDSIVLETLSGRGTLYEIIHHKELLRRIDALIKECDWNNRLLKEILRVIKENKEKRKKDKGKAETEKEARVTSRFTSSCAELLYVERYLNENDDFYSAISKCFTSVGALNDQLRMWDEEWFEENSSFYFERFKNHKETLLKAKERLSNRYYYIDL